MLSRMPAPSAATPGTALVTGGTAGLGHEFARQLAGRGHDLVLVARNPDRLEEVAADLRTRYGVAVEVIAADLVDRADLALVEQRLADPARPVDLLVNNAGFGLKHNFLDNDVAAEQAHLDVLVVAPMRLMHAALGAMVGRGRGRVLNVSSVSAFLPRGSYAAAKAYVNKISEWAHHEYADRGVTVAVLCPGFVRTEFHQRMDVGRDSAPSFLWLDPEFVVTRALADLDDGKVYSIPSARYKLIVGAARHVPAGVLQRFQSVGRR
jgi:short-subunit dehydrogenase